MLWLMCTLMNKPFMSVMSMCVCMYVVCVYRYSTLAVFTYAIYELLFPSNWSFALFGGISSIPMYPQSLLTTILFSASVRLTFLNCMHKWDYVAFLWLAYFTFHDILQVYPDCCKWLTFLPLRALNSIPLCVCLVHLFILQSIDGHFKCFHVLAVVTDAAVNGNVIWIYLRGVISVPWNIYSEVRLLEHLIILSLDVVQASPYSFPKLPGPLAVYESCIFFTCLPACIVFIFLKTANPKGVRRYLLEILMISNIEHLILRSTYLGLLLSFF